MGFAISVIGVWTLLVCASPAYAYVDPGTGSMMIQLLLGGVAGLAVLVRLSWHRLVSVFNFRKDAKIRRPS
jgi:hypothetical protein